MANRYGDEDVPRRGPGGSRAESESWRERESDERSGGDYGGMASEEQGYRPSSYERLLDVTERYYGYGEEEYGLAREEDELYWYEQEQRQRGAEASSELFRDEQPRPRAVESGREPWSDEWMGFESSRGKGPKGYTRSDERIREDVCERLMHSPYDASDVEVTVSRGEVTLLGTVRNRADKWGIEDVAEAILGIQAVHNQIRVTREEVQTSGATPRVPR